MILTVTMNPSVDISYPLQSLEIDTVNRVSNVSKEAGGKGLNVSRVIKQANEKVLATGLLGGTLGNYIINQLDAENIKHCFYQIAHESRNCIAILHEGLQTEILESGPVISEQEQAQFLTLFHDLTDTAQIITISGSLPTGIPPDYYKKLIAIAHKKNKKVLLDCSGEGLKIAINGPYCPYLIKPNQDELEKLTKSKLDVGSISSFIDIVNNHPELQKIPWIVVSLGRHGAFAKINERFYTIQIPEINAVNSVGSGDATIAGLAISLSHHKDAEMALKKAMAFGIMNTMEERTGCININNLAQLLNRITVYPKN